MATATRPRLRFITLFALVLIAVNASPARAASPTLTGSQYRAQANAICAELDNHAPPSAYVARVEAALAIAHRAFRALRKLKPPQELAPIHTRLTVLYSGGLATLDPLVAQLRTGKLSVSQFDAVARPLISSLDKSEHALWVKLGAKVCADR